MKYILLIVVVVNLISFVSCNPNSETSEKIVNAENVNPANVQMVKIEIEGMVCTGCENHINGDILKMEGVLSSKTSHEEGSSVVEFDKTKLKVDDIITTVNATGYEATGHQLVEKEI